MSRRYLSVCSLILLIFVPFFLSFQKVHADSKIVINEIFVHPASGDKEWVELYSPDDTDLTTYWIDDDTSFTEDSGSSPKKNLSTVTSGQDVKHPFIETSSMFNNSGDYVVLFDSTGTIVDQYQYTKDPGSAVPMGRSPDGSGEFQILASATQGNFNTPPQPTDTPTSPPAPTATHTPKPTHTPTPTKTPTSTKTPTTASGKSTSAGTSSQTSLATKTKLLVADTRENFPSIDVSNIPTSILGVSTTAASVTISATPLKKVKEEVLIKGSSTQSNQSTAIIFIGSAILLLTCGILVYWKIRKKESGSMN